MTSGDERTRAYLEPGVFLQPDAVRVFAKAVVYEPQRAVDVHRLLCVRQNRRVV